MFDGYGWEAERKGRKRQHHTTRSADTVDLIPDLGSRYDLSVCSDRGKALFPVQKHGWTTWWHSNSESR